MSAIEGKYELELNFVGDGRVFLNFWDFMHGDDVIAEIKDRELYRDGVLISMGLFIDEVEKSVSNWKMNKL
jgi:hypothetical protein